MDDTPELAAMSDDVVLLLSTTALLIGERIMADAEAAGCADLRVSDGYVFQHLVAGARRVSDLAPLLGISQQGASKLVADLERRSYVTRTVDPEDARVRLVALSDLGERAVRSGRRSRQRIAAELRAAMGDTRWVRFAHGLSIVTDELGGFEALRGRRLRPPT